MKLLSFPLSPLPAFAAAQAAAAPAMDHPAVDGTPGHPERLTGAVSAERGLDVAALKAPAPRDSGPAEEACASGIPQPRVDNFRGTRPTDAIGHAGLDIRDHKDARRVQ